MYSENSNILDERRPIMDTKKIGAFIAMNRKKKGYTQEQLAEKLGVTNKTISRWENGHYMPDLSLLEPLSKELDITLNELLAGEEIVKEEAMEYSEQNLIQTIDYTDKKIKDEHKKISLFIIGLGIFTSLCAFTVFPSESSWGSIYSMIGLFLFVVGIFRELKITSLLKKGLISIILFALLLGIFFIFDYASVTQFKQPPIYRLITTTIFSNDGNKMIEYKNPFYNVFRINADTPNEYYLIDNKEQYTIDTVPTSPFNVDKSSFEQLKKYKSKYIGDNSNTSHFLNALPLSEYGYVFENCNFTGNCPDGTCYLSRPWRIHAKTVLINCKYSSQIAGSGFHDWNKPEAHETTFYAEYNGYGEGYKPNERASFAHILTADEAAMYTKENVLGKDFR